MSAPKISRIYGAILAILVQALEVDEEVLDWDFSLREYFVTDGVTMVLIGLELNEYFGLQGCMLTPDRTPTVRALVEHIESLLQNAVSDNGQV